MARSQGSRAGETLAGKYRLDGLLGSGGMGEVYRSENTLIGRVVAIKVMRGEMTENPDLVARFLREARAANIVRHPNVVDVLDIGQTEDGAPFIVQELLEGVDLSAYVESRGGRLAPAEAIDLLVPVIDAVAYAHERGVIHRDLKPENVFLARSGAGQVPKLLDFGISRIAGPDEAKMTATGVSMGTPAYMSPEQVTMNRPVDARSDVWAFGIILHELVSGELPYAADAPSSLFVKIATEAPISLDVAMPGTPRELTAIVAKCLKRNPDDRFASAADLARELRAITSRGILATAVHAPSGSPPKPNASARQNDPTAFAHVAPPSAEVPDLALPKPKPRTSGAPPSAAKQGHVALGTPGPSMDLDDVVPITDLRLDMGAPLHNEQQPSSMRVARANLAMREALPDDDHREGGRGVLAVAVMWGITLGLTFLLMTYVPFWKGGWPVTDWAQRLDSAPMMMASSVIVAVVLVGLGAAFAGWRADPMAWGLILAGLGLVLDAVLLGGFFIRTLPSLTGTGAMDALARLIFPWSTMLIAVGMALLALRRAWQFWSAGASGERFGGTLFHVLLAAIALFGAAQVVRGNGGHLPGMDEDGALEPRAALRAPA